LVKGFAVAGVLETIRQEAAVLKGAPWSVAIIVAATIGATIVVAQWVYGARFDAMTEEMRLKDQQLAMYSAQPASSSEQPKPSSSAAPTSSVAAASSSAAPSVETMFSDSQKVSTYEDVIRGWAKAKPDPTKPDPNVIYK